MTKPQKAAEPSMEEILASIRKIIADDPVSSRKSLSTDAAPPKVTLAAPEPSAPRKSALDDILGLADPASKLSAGAPNPTPAASAAPAPPAPRADRRPAGSDVPSWLFPAPLSGAAAAAPQPRSPGQPAPAPQASAASSTQPVPSISIAPEPFFQPAPVKAAPDQAAKPDPAPARPAPAPSQRPLDIGAIVPARGEPANEIAPADRKADTARIPEWMARPSAPKPASEPILPSFADNPPKAKTSEGPLSVAARIDMATERTEIVRPVDPAAATSSPPPKSSAPAASDPAPQKSPMPESGAAPVTAERPLPSAGASTPSADVPQAAQQSRSPFAANEPFPQSQPSPAPSEKGNGMVTVPVADQAPAISRPAVVGARATKVAPSVEVMSTVLPGSSVRTLEDTVVDLLRPMIRQWLDDHMPRMVEKALRIELAESVKPKVETKQKH